jgi:hypothetical protein
MGSGRRITVDGPPPPRIFPAAYGGTCGCCGLDFDEGDPIGYLDDEICCEDCVLE